MSRDWVAWHDAYDDPSSRLSRRLAVVQRYLTVALDAQQPGPIRIVSMCAGQGRDVIGALRTHDRRDHVRARLVEIDPTLAAGARDAAARAGFQRVEVVCADASVTTPYAGLVPANVVVACGIFGNITPEDIQHTVSELPRLCAADAWVVWTRHPRDPALIDDIHSWFEAGGFVSHEWEQEDDTFGVGLHRFGGEPLPFVAGRRLFTFAT